MQAANGHMKNITYLSFFLCVGLLLSGCLGPRTPQAVAQAFWRAVIANDSDDVVAYSTLTDPKAFNGFGLDWHGITPEWGKIVIDGDRASIETRFSGAAGNPTTNRQCITYLVRKDGKWKVDYNTTANDLHGGALGVLFGTLNQMGNEISKSLDDSVKALNLEMDRLSRRLKAMSDTLSREAEKIIDRHAQELQRIMQQLEDSINRALQDKDNHLSDQDRQVMASVSSNLAQSGRQLAQPTTASITESNYQMGMAQQRLANLDSRVADQYVRQWQTLERQFETDMRQMLDELASSVNAGQQNN